MLGVALGLGGGGDHGVRVAVAERGDLFGVCAVAAGAGEGLDAGLGAGGLGGDDAVVIAVTVLGRCVVPLGDQRAARVGLDQAVFAYVIHGAVAVGKAPAGKGLALGGAGHAGDAKAVSGGAPDDVGDGGIDLAAAVGDGNALHLLQQREPQYQRILGAGAGETGDVKVPGVLVDKILVLERDLRCLAAGPFGGALQRGAFRYGVRIAGAKEGLRHIVTGRGRDDQVLAHQIAEVQPGGEAQLIVAEAKAEAQSFRQRDVHAVELLGTLVSELIGDGNIHREAERLPAGDGGVKVGAGGRACDLKHKDQNEQETQRAFPILLHIHSPQSVSGCCRNRSFRPLTMPL